MKLGYFLSSEEWGPAELAERARKAPAAGLDRLWISDRYHRCNEEQGHGPFVAIGTAHRICPSESSPGERVRPACA